MVIAKIREQPAEFRLHLHNHRDLLMALGKCEDGLQLRLDLARQSGDRFQHVAREWFET